MALLRFGTVRNLYRGILQGKGPKDIPVEQPTEVRAGVNLKTAKALGLSIPDRFMQRADEVIE
jgi:putative ABC transport system substrate-binding protein